MSGIAKVTSQHYSMTRMAEMGILDHGVFIFRDIKDSFSL